ncbi:MAG: cyclase family protein [Chloroflexi bacterium]|nr:cyclase family protein [Chloroflexota bacterium]
MTTRIFDITRPVTPSLAVWPGDTPYRTEYLLRMDAGGSVNLSTITFSGHCGTHADAHFHYDPAGERLAQMPLDAYIGPATVIDLRDALPDGGAILPAHLAGVELSRVRRLLVKSKASFVPDDRWDENFVYLAPETAQLLVDSGLRLFGADAPSVDPQESKTLTAHKTLRTGNVAILEILQLKDIAPGEYELIALPLKVDNDGAPVRAILRRDDGMMG